MSDLLTHWAVMDDSRRLMPFIDGVDPLFGETLQRHHLKARFGAISRTEGYWIPPTMRWIRAKWNDRDPGEFLESKLAFCVAGLTHTACDAQMKISRILATERLESSDRYGDKDIPRLVYAYQDAHVFQEVYKNGDEPPFNRFMLAENRTRAGRRLERMAQALYQSAILGTRHWVADLAELDRDFLESHIRKTYQQVLNSSDAVRRIVGSKGLLRDDLYQWLREVRLARIDRDKTIDYDWETVEALLAPDMGSPRSRLENILLNQLRLYVDHRRLEKAHNKPDEKLKALLKIETEFYRKTDPAIRMARAIQEGFEPGKEEAREVIDGDANQSYYGKSLALAMEYLKRGTDYWRLETDILETPNLGEGKAVEFRFRNATKEMMDAERRF